MGSQVLRLLGLLLALGLKGRKVGEAGLSGRFTGIPGDLLAERMGPTSLKTPGTVLRRMYL